MQKLAEYWKACLAFVSLVVTNAAADWTQRGEPWPTNWGDAARWGLSVAVGTWLVYQKANAPRAG